MILTNEEAKALIVIGMQKGAIAYKSEYLAALVRGDEKIAPATIHGKTIEAIESDDVTDAELYAWVAKAQGRLEEYRQEWWHEDIL